MVIFFLPRERVGVNTIKIYLKAQKSGLKSWQDIFSLAREVRPNI